MVINLSIGEMRVRQVNKTGGLALRGDPELVSDLKRFRGHDPTPFDLAHGVMRHTCGLASIPSSMSSIKQTCENLCR